MMASQSPSPKKRRSEQSHRAILEATLGILAEQSYAALTIDGVAARARVSKQTIYRWWSSKAAIVLDALLSHAQERLSVPDTGTVRGDLQVLLQSLLDELGTHTGVIVRGLMAEAQLDPNFAQMFREHLIAQRRQVVIDILQRGQQRGDFPMNEDLEFRVDVFYGVIWYRLLVQHAPLDGAFAQQLLNQMCLD